MDTLTFTQANDSRWQEYDDLAARSYGHPVGDITALRAHADLRVALRDGRVVAGGLGFVVDQYFGGSPVPSACLAAGCVAPEERGAHLHSRMAEERLEPLREQGAVISVHSTTSNGYARRLGWEAPTPVFAWTVATEDLNRSFTSEAFEIHAGLTEDASDLQRVLAKQWNGPVHRPAWWASWKEKKSALTTYCFSRDRGSTAGLLSLTTKRHERHGMTLVVHDFWAASEPTAAAMFAFLGRHNTRAANVEFRRGALPPYPALLHNLHRFRPTAESWHPWMLRILNAPEAIRLRGWPADVTTQAPIEIQSESGNSWDRWMLQVKDGKAELTPTQIEGLVLLTRRQLAAWYAGGYRSATSARMAGVQAVSEKALRTLVRATADLEPWLPDHF
ncbi:enhanced intracellular survival protein Eis [Streptomyces sp. N35]|uniref:GNAT family N-acetyltransferase n=1 Tax=Streptomyces sp. N35 TaxID=2795730 RepID=UPI0018F32EBF|nr:GNAT family N-acetyltransferase [Streptomyces sp. N35]